MIAMKAKGIEVWDLDIYSLVSVKKSGYICYSCGETKVTKNDGRRLK